MPHTLCLFARVSAGIVAAAASVAMLFAAPLASAASPAVGDTLVFRVVNGYSKEAQGKIQHHIDRIDADRVTISVTADVVALGSPRTEVYSKDGNWLRHTLINHDEPVEYEFSPTYPAYVFPLETGKSWSLRVTATNPLTGQRNSVRVDGEVLGSERLITPAGAFDTIKVRRRVYAGDWEAFRRETQITETDWYAPALGRAVKVERVSNYIDPGRCSMDTLTYLFPRDAGQFPARQSHATALAGGQRDNPIIKTGWHAPGHAHSGRDSASQNPARTHDYVACEPMRGDWNIFELIEIRSPKP